MPKTMQAAVLRTLRQPLKIEKLPVPEPGHGEILIKVIACGVCHSDLHAVDGDWDPPPNLPLIPGHEVVGTVAALGVGVSDLRKGDMVGVPWMYSACGRCEYCTGGMETICPKAESAGYSKPGGYAEYMIAPAAYCGRLAKDTDPFSMAPILCAGVTTYRGLKRTRARPGQWVTVIGIGGLGHLAVQYARVMGMRVVAVDVDAAKLKLAKKLGAEHLIDAREEDPVKAVRKLVGGSHGALVTAVAPKAFEQALGVCRPAGTVVYIGLPGGEQDTIRAAISGIVNGEMTLTGSNVGTRQDLEEAIAFAAAGQVKAQIAREPLANVNDIFDRMRKGRITGRIVLDIAG
jgi:propanol-preferring alcohol dehydrogenase